MEDLWSGCDGLAKKMFPGRSIRFIHRYWMTDIPEITKYFEGFDEDISFNFSYKYSLLVSLLAFSWRWILSWVESILCAKKPFLPSGRS